MQPPHAVTTARNFGEFDWQKGWLWNVGASLVVIAAHSAVVLVIVLRHYCTLNRSIDLQTMNKVIKGELPKMWTNLQTSHANLVCDVCVCVCVCAVGLRVCIEELTKVICYIDNYETKWHCRLLGMRGYAYLHTNLYLFAKTKKKKKVCA